VSKKLTLCLICSLSPFLSLNIHVLGNISTEYVAEETPVPTYYNAHLALEQLRVSCRPPPSFLPSDDPIRSLHPSQQEDETLGPRVLVVGETGSGKSTLCKSLINWAIRMGKARRDGDWTDYGEGRKVMFVNLDPADVRHRLLLLSSSYESANLSILSHRELLRYLALSPQPLSPPSSRRLRQSIPSERRTLPLFLHYLSPTPLPQHGSLPHL
jgi:hypothetical protein